MAKASATLNAHILIGGNLNFPNWDCERMSLKVNPVCARLHNEFIKQLEDCRLGQGVKEPCRLDNTLDLILSNSPYFIPRVKVLPEVSDHDAVPILRAANQSPKTEASITADPSSSKCELGWSKKNCSRFTRVARIRSELYQHRPIMAAISEQAFHINQRMHTS